jgi:chemotaxis response regulator CheB
MPRKRKSPPSPPPEPQPVSTEQEKPLGPVDARTGYSSFPIVGIGASAGGLDALTQLLQHVRPDTGMAFVVVQHLDPRHESRLTDLLARATSMPVTEATHGLDIEPDHVYVIPANANLAISRGVLHVTPRKEVAAPAQRRTGRADRMGTGERSREILRGWIRSSPGQAGGT